MSCSSCPIALIELYDLHTTAASSTSCTLTLSGVAALQRLFFSNSIKHRSQASLHGETCCYRAQQRT
jgi:hypothetical protein